MKEYRKKKIEQMSPSQRDEVIRTIKERKDQQK